MKKKLFRLFVIFFITTNSIAFAGRAIRYCHTQEKNNWNWENFFIIPVLMVGILAIISIFGYLQKKLKNK